MLRDGYFVAFWYWKNTLKLLNVSFLFPLKVQMLEGGLVFIYSLSFFGIGGIPEPTTQYCEKKKKIYIKVLGTVLKTFWN